MGHGLFEINLRSILNATDDLTSVAQQITGEYSTGYKEKRIIDSLVSPMQRHRVIVHKQVFDSDVRYGKQHAIADRTQYSLWYQLANVTTDRNSLPHDDRLEAMAGAVREFKYVLDQDAHKASELRKEAEYLEFRTNPMGYLDAGTKFSKGTKRTLDNRAQRRKGR